MKELTIEEKAKAYDETIEKLRNFHRDYDIVSGLIDVKEELVNLFPELRASEDERIRGAIIDHLKDYNLTEWAAWLEKQGRTFTKKDVDDAYLKGVCNTKQELEKQGEKKPYGQRKECEDCQFNYAGKCKGYCQMKRDEQRSADKVEPRFKVGEWVVFNDKHWGVYQIEKIENFQYTLRHIFGGSMPLSFSHEDMIRLWTIQNARDGDVLQLGMVTAIFRERIDNVNCKCYCSVYDGEFEIPSQDGIDNSYGCHDAIPATKEQCDLLFQKMKEAGYEWDAEKKELKKIEQKFNIGDEIKNANEEPLTITKIDEKGYWSKDLLICSFDDAAKWELVEQKPAWSEEDETCLKNAIMYCEWARDKAPDLPCYETSEKSIDWLKSLKQRYTWKPSDEQIRRLEYFVKSWGKTEDTENTKVFETVKSLLNDLKQLKQL